MHPLVVRIGSLPPEPRTGFGTPGTSMYASSVAFLYMREQLSRGDLDATIACRSRVSTVIARLRIKGKKLSVEEALDAKAWIERLTLLDTTDGYERR